MTPESQPVRIRDMPWEELRKMIRQRGPEIGRLAANGDKLAQAVEAAYRYGYDHPADRAANDRVRAAMEDYMHRELLIGEVRDLGSRLGHRIDQ